MPPRLTAPARLDSFCIRLTIAMLYRAGLDTMDHDCALATEAQDFLQSGFASLALQILHTETVNGSGWGNVSDYLGQIQRVARKRAATNAAAGRIVRWLGESGPDE